MIDKFIYIFSAGCIVGLVWFLSMRSTPGRGFTKVLERCAGGAIVCVVFYVLLKPAGINVPRNPLSAVLTGYLGLPGMAFAMFLSSAP